MARAPADAALVLLLTISGCSASGYPDFVKFSPDGRVLVYQDARYPRVYVYNLGTREKHVLKGRVACFTRGLDRFVLLADRYAGCKQPRQPLPCRLVTTQRDDLIVQTLPALPITAKLPLISMEFGSSEGQQLRATVFDNQYMPDACEPGRYYTLKLGDPRWTELAFPEESLRKPLWQWPLPGGLRDGGHVYCPVHDPAAVPEAEMWGINVEDEFRNGRYGHVLHSPDERFIVKVNDVDDSWQRLTLIDAATGEKEIILDKNDAALDVLSFMVKIPLLPFTPLLPKF